MNDTQITRILKKHGLESEHYIGFYKAFPNDRWFEPSNNSDQSFSVANHMHELGLLRKMINPQWNNGSFVGYKILFKKLSDILTEKAV